MLGVRGHGPEHVLQRVERRDVDQLAAFAPMTKSVRPTTRREPRLFVWCVWLATIVLMAASSATSPRAQSSGERPPFVAIEQDGKAVASLNGEVTLRRAPFILVVRFPQMTVAKVHVSQSAVAYELQRKAAACDDPSARRRVCGGGPQ